VSLEESIEPDNEVRLIDLFVDSLNLTEFGFNMDFIENGRPAYHPADLLKLFLYGYLNKIRSSRSLEKECKRNIEVMWLLKSLCPDHNTISNFRKNNPKAIKKVFRATVRIAKDFDLIGGKLLAADSSKFRAQNSKKNNYNHKKVERHLDYIDRKLDEYYQALDSSDDHTAAEIQDQIDTQLQRKEKYLDLKDQLEQSDEVQISTSDPDSRQLITRNTITEVGYNIQSTVDAKHCLPIDYKVTNENDSKALGPIATKAVELLGHSDFTLLLDKGYHTGTELKTAQELGIETLVAIPATPSSSMAPDPAYNVSEFSYDPDTDTYTCPQNHTLTSNGHWYKKTRADAPSRKGSVIHVKHYKTPHCKTCPVQHLCTKNTSGRGRVIERSEYAPYIEKNRQNIEQKEHLYKRRQAIVEHPFGIIKRQWGFYFISTKKTMKHAAADIGLIFTAYNLRRLFNILDHTTLRKYLRVLSAVFKAIFCHFKTFWRVLILVVPFTAKPHRFDLPVLYPFRLAGFDYF
jgi:radical SAM protein with 4Fe4S-binding SPASM domain